MFLIMGMKVKFKPLDSGTFHCPRCAGDRQYTRHQARRWFTIFFIPVIPLGTIGTVVRCDSCGGQFGEDVLTAATSADRASALADAMRAVMAALIAAAHDDGATVAAATATLREWGLPGYGDTDLAWDRQSRAHERAQALVSGVAGGLDPVRRERVLGDALRVALVDGTLSRDEDTFVRNLGSWLGLTSANIEGVIAQVAPSAGRPAR